MISCHVGDHYDTETKQHSMEWRHIGSHNPKITRYKHLHEKFSPGFLVSSRQSPHSLSSKGPIFQHGVLLISAVQLKTYWRKSWRMFYQVGLVLTRQHPTSPGTCNPKEAGLSGLPCFQYLDHPPYSPELTPLDYHVFLGMNKTIKTSLFFAPNGGHCSHGEHVEPTNLWKFLHSLQKLELRAKKYIELRGGYVE
jgi:hypothetical protein